MNLQQNTNISADIAIIGMACRFPKAKTLDEFWFNILHQIDATVYFSDEELRKEGVHEQEFKKWNYVKAKPYLDGIEDFDAEFFGFSAREAKYLDPQIRLFLEVAHHALEDAAYNSERYSGKVGVFAGASTSLEWVKRILRSPKGLSHSEEFESWILSSKDFLSQILSYRLNLTGPSYTVYTACSTSLVAVHLACQSLLSNECSLALAGGVTVDLPARGGYTYEQGMIHSPSGKCRPFDRAADGTIFGDGAGVVILKKLEKAIQDHDRVYAIIKGSCCNNDGKRKSGFLAPSVAGQQEVMEEAYGTSNIPIESIDYLETHGTATKIGDPIEFEGLKNVHCKRHTPCVLGSVKANIGHLHAAAGVAGLIKAVLAIKNKTIPPLTNFESLNPDINNPSGRFSFPKEAMFWEKQLSHPRRAAISSFGVGGTNVHLILEEYSTSDQEIAFQVMDKPYIFPLSAKTSGALERMSACFFEYLQAHKDIKLSSIAFTLQFGREPFAYRKVFIADSYESLLKSKGENSKISSGYCARPLIFFFMKHQSINPKLYIKRAKCAELNDFNKELQLLLTKYLPAHVKKEVLLLLGSASISDSPEGKLADFLYNLIQVQYLLAFGIKPNIILGKGDGAYIAAICALPDQFEHLFVFYLYKLAKHWVNLTAVDATEIDKIIGQHNLEKFNQNGCTHDACYLFYGGFEKRQESNIHKNVSEESRVCDPLPLCFGRVDCLLNQFLKNGQPYFVIQDSKDLDLSNIKRLIANIWQSGVTVDWQKMNQGLWFPMTPLPPYPFEKKRHWLDINDVLEPLPELSLDNMPYFSDNKIIELVSAIFKEILNLPSFNVNDNFFRLGGDSLQLIQIVSRVNASFGVDISVEEVYMNPNISKVIELVKIAKK